MKMNLTRQTIIEYKTILKGLLYVEGRHTFDQIENVLVSIMESPEERHLIYVRWDMMDGILESNYIEGDDTMICDSSALRFGENSSI